MRNTSLVAAAAAAFIAASLPTPASGHPPQSSDRPVVERISYADLDLSSAVGQKRLKERIGFAAYTLCVVPSTATSYPSVADAACSREVMTQGLAQMERAVGEATTGPALAQARH